MAAADGGPTLARISTPPGTSTPEVTSRGSRARSVQDWLARRADTSIGRLSSQWFRAYFAASRNSGCAVTIYSTLVGPPRPCSCSSAYFHPAGSDTQRLRAAPDRPPQPERLHGRPRPGHLRERLVERARGDLRRRGQLPVLGNRHRAALPGCLLEGMGDQGRIAGGSGAVRHLLLRLQRSRGARDDRLGRSSTTRARSCWCPPGSSGRRSSGCGCRGFSSTGRWGSAPSSPARCSRHSFWAAPPPHHRSSWLLR